MRHRSPDTESFSQIRIGFSVIDVCVEGACVGGRGVCVCGGCACVRRVCVCVCGGCVGWLELVLPVKASFVVWN